MADLDLDWRGDLDLTPDGDLLLSDGPELVRQRIMRRLFTTGRSYIWHPSYGAGLPERIGRVARAANIRALVRAQIALEATVAKVPVPEITVPEDPTVSGLYAITIRYTEAVTGVAIQISLEVPGRE